MYLCCHDKTTGSGIYGDVTSHQTNILKLFKQVSILLVAERCDGSRVDDTLLLLQRHRNRVSEA